MKWEAACAKKYELQVSNDAQEWKTVYANKDGRAYLLELDHLKLDLESMFLDKEDRPVLCYLPEYEKKIRCSRH